MTPTAVGGRVLVVEDDRAFRHAISTFLREAGHDVTEVSEEAPRLRRSPRVPSM